MVEMRQSATQRIQVGIVGLVIVLLFVTLANMAIDRGNTNQAAEVQQGALPTGTVAKDNGKIKDEPLAELGVTPVAPDAKKAEARTAAPPPPGNVTTARPIQPR